MTRTPFALALFALAVAGVAGAQSAPSTSTLHGALSKARGAAAPAQSQAAQPKPSATKPAPPTATSGKPAATATKPAATTAKPATTTTTTRGPAIAALPDSMLTIKREVFTYDAGNRRDPFVSLMASGELRPAFQDLVIVGIAYDPTGRNSVAVMRDMTSNDQYRVKVGQIIGRMRIAQIQPKQVVFTIEELGFSRQETLVLGDTTRVRKK